MHACPAQVAVATILACLQATSNKPGRNMYCYMRAYRNNNYYASKQSHKIFNAPTLHDHITRQNLVTHKF